MRARSREELSRVPLRDRQDEWHLETQKKLQVPVLTTIDPKIDLTPFQETHQDAIPKALR